jgi:Flp pilus assembly protein TadG
MLDSGNRRKSLRSCTRRRGASRHKPRRGAAIVEFALVVPLLSLLLLGLFEFGRVIMVQQVLTNAAREAAREASLLSTSDTLVQQAASRFTDAANLSGVAILVDPDSTTAEPGDDIQVTVRVPIENVSWLSANWFPAGYQVSAIATMRKEGFD